MSYLSLYRKYRSQSFDEVSGQDHVTRTLRNAIRADRVAHAYLFCGARGTGKTTMARLLAKCLNCEHGPTPEPCNACDNCLRIRDGSSMDVIEIDAASNRGIDEIRTLREKVQYSPSQSRKKVYVLDEVHMLTSEAFNALLKTLEEPPGHVVFILATTEAHKIPATILSRCQRFDFRRGSLAQIGDRLRYVAVQEGCAIEPAAVERIARGAGGSWRDALSLLEQVLSYGETTITEADVTHVLGTVDADSLHALAEAVHTGDGAALFGTIEELIAAGKDARQLTRDLVEHFRTLLLAAVGAAPASEEGSAALARQAATFGTARLVRSVELLAQVEKDARWSDQSRLALEVALVRLMRLDDVTGRDERGRAGDGATGREATGRESAVGTAARAVPTSARPRATPAPAAVLPPEPPKGAAAAPAGGPSDQRPGGGVPLRETEAGYDPFMEETLPPEELAAPASVAADAGSDGRGTSTDEPPAPAVRSAAAGSQPGLAAIQARWAVVVEELKRRKAAMAAALLSEAAPARLDGDTLVIQFKYSTHVEAFQQRDCRPPLEAALQSVFGARYRLQLESGKPEAGDGHRGVPSGGKGGMFARTSPARPAESSPPLPEPPPAVEGEAGLSSEPGAADRLVHEVIAIFNGKIIDEE